MTNESNESPSYLGKLRVRSCGILIKDQKVLLVNHRGIGIGSDFWAPPGGGVKFKETLREAAIREFQEETHLDVQILKLIASREFIKNNLHAIEFFFEVNQTGGLLEKGFDPEYSVQDQIINQVKWHDLSSLAALPNHAKHNILHNLTTLEELLEESQFLEFPNNSN